MSFVRFTPATWQQQPALLRHSLICLTGIFFLALTAHLSLPLSPVPLTFQSTAILLVGFILGPRLAGMTVLGYLAAGIAGAPVFSPATQHIMTAGYLAGFLPAAMLTGWFAEKQMAKTFLQRFLVSCLGSAVIFGCGLSVLSSFIGWHAAIATGLMPFVISEPLKLLALSVVVRRQ